MNVSSSPVIPLITTLLLLLLTTAVTARSEQPGAGVGGTKESTDSAWRSADALHPIQAEMRPYVREMIAHAFDSYMKYAFPKDELCAVSGTGKDTMGGYGWTLIDALDTLAVSGLHAEFRRYAKWVEDNVNFDIDVSVSVFETAIRAIGGLLAAHFMYEEGVVEVVATEHNYTGGLVRLAADLGDRILPSFHTATGIPYGAINLRRGVSPTETTMTCTAVGGTFLVELTALSAATGDDRYERAARRASEALFAARDPSTGLMGSHIDIETGRWRLTESHVGGEIDSAIEYYIKSHSMSGDIGDWERFERSVRAVNRYVRKGGMLLAVEMGSGRRTRTTHESLSSFFPGNLLLGGHHTEAVESSWPIHSIFKHLGGLPESFCLATGRIGSWGRRYPQRPEHVESLYMLYRATRDPAYLVMGRELAMAINLRMRTPYGFSTLNNVEYPHRDELHDDSMESFMLAETLKYLYLLFDECNTVHLQGKIRGGFPSYCADTWDSGSAASHVGWVFNTEAHLFPNTAEWWASTSVDDTFMCGRTDLLLWGVDMVPVLSVSDDRFGCGATTVCEVHPVGLELHRRRLEVIDDLLKGLDRGAGMTDGKDAVPDAVTHEYYCANHALNDVERLSRSFFR
ncbi:mannosyl-oligosaccharide 1,2-alpha-mannosidase IB [Trypanosoma grayi]|uniref:mannosyl-oligosaccharide 1,2-alpha-mannosidase IB n=1 Tax=Trypanosoma grayi TaxID=71804 RepID=UPI0004F43104|nr:mannosyl-oligosaccharide 1,2-alpha-mannosidase IB [Trypanosoma grayi]KEG09089.1 mannosyl-oligosaccharide 1,2-alpha-mannosidase IB [Trypanosoma grayi]